MDELPISAGTVAGLGIAAIVNIALPFALWIVWRKSSRASWLPLLAGVIGYLAAGAVHGVARAILLADLRSAPWLFYTMQAVFAGIFEEGTRYLIFRFGIPHKDNYRDAASYGIGHGGAEHLIVSSGGMTRLYAFLVAWFYKVYGAAAFAPGGAGAFLMEGLDEAGTTDILRSVSEEKFVTNLLETAGTAADLILHICLSVLVFTAVHYALDLKWLFAAVGLHALGHLPAAFHMTGHLSIPEAAVLDLLYTAGLVYLACRVRAHYCASRSVPEAGS